MSSALRVVALVGSPTSSATSRTLLLVRHLLDSLQQRVHASVELVELATIARALGQSLSRGEVEPAVEQALQTIEAAELLVVAAPVYRGSYPGLFKHLVDFIELEALVDTPVLLAATGGSERHALVIDHQLRPLFSFLQAHTLPIGVYATSADFEGEHISSAALQARIELATERAAGHLATQAQALTVAAPLRRIA
ncbi:FMN reductase [Stenotrophomonas maltophilia]|uniref:FMN reductase n=1 Tax=Stenotrophomonas maltophilia TaxID=40324 RepID=UPI0015E050B0|nr:FMN reductase [Stenotrophomonas maltophilia]ELN2584076.1 FMN reductase [Stenotrophomonas maltophilia]ELN2593310.1 FMN reductase [Stenotrophomonas maltophilia]MBA0297006.1 FMN reductase [Stenotrophomonas maltophilia]MBH1399890.1 FMN reductase [Stenotrophomonas maltophilia]MBH1702326.1 FMN reductase [Stenotrophomonas maltophilia]